MKKKVICLGLILGFGYGTGLAAPIGNISVFAIDDFRKEECLKDNKVKVEVFYGPTYFKWTEKNEGEKLLTEKGWIHKTGIGIKVDVESSYLRPSFIFYGGDIKYDGKTWEGDKVRSRTNYIGHDISLEGGIERKVGRTTLDGYVKMGIERWKRSIDSNISENGNVAIGYGEKWRMWYWTVGVKQTYEINKDTFLFGNLYVKRPFNVRNKVDIVDVEVKLKKKWNYGIEVGVEAKDVLKRGINGKVSFIYENEKFGKSNMVYSSVIDDYVYQPESKRTQYGIKVGIKF